MIARRIALWTGLLVAPFACNKSPEESQAPVDAGDPGGGPPLDPDGEAPEGPSVAEEESPYLDAMNFNRVVEAHAGEVVACWRETAGKEAAPAKGRVKTTVVVDGDGRVKSITFDPQRSTLKHEGLFACMEGKLKALKFNITLNGADSPMPYTFDLSDGGLLKQ
mgnify:CR=1 FL=1